MAKYWEEEAQFKASGFDAILPRLNKFNQSFGKDTKWSSLTDEDVSDLVAWLKTCYVPITKVFKDRTETHYTDRLLSPRTINKHLATLGRIDNLVKKKWKTLEPAQFDISEHKLKVPDSKKPFFSPEQDKEIFKNMPEHWRQGFKFALLTGIRAQHIFVKKSKHRPNRSIRRKDICLESKTLTIYGKSKNPGGKIIEIPLIDEAIDMLVNELNIKALTPDDPIFVYPKGHRLEGEPLGDYRKPLYAAMEKAGFRFLHKLRRRNASDTSHNSNQVDPIRCGSCTGTRANGSCRYCDNSNLHYKKR